MEKKTEKNPGHSRLAKRLEESPFPHSHRTLVAISNFIEKLNKQIIVVCNPLAPLIDSTPPPLVHGSVLQRQKALCVYVHTQQSPAIKYPVAFKVIQQYLSFKLSWYFKDSRREKDMVFFC